MAQFFWRALIALMLTYSRCLWSRSASVSLCLGRASAFSFGVGRGREGGGVPTRSRALALTALVAEKVFFVLAMEEALPDTAYIGVVRKV